MAKTVNYIGLMSGTSVDGVDGVIVDENCKKIIQSIHLPYPTKLKQQLRTLAKTGKVNLEALSKLDIEVSTIFAQTVHQLLTEAELSLQSIKAIGSHGQTIYHQGGEYSMQIGHGALIAEQTGITTVADFRMQDVAAGGQGAPLTPLYHQHLLNGKDGVVINLGGIANITMAKNDVVLGFDTGPANTLLDNWIFTQKQLDYDKDGSWASRGSVNETLLKALLADEYFAQKPPKSTGVEYFNINWLLSFLNHEQPVDVQRTLLELTAISISQHIPAGERVYLCGGGVHNVFLFERLVAQNPNSKISTTEELGVPVDYVEAAAFAFFAKLRLGAQPANLPSITGAKGERLLGAVYPFKNG